MGALEALFGLAFAFITAYFIFLLGEKRVRRDKYPFLSGERIKIARIIYSAKWMHYVFLLVAIDAAVAVLLLSAPAISDVALAFLLIISLFLPPLVKRW